LQWNILVCFWPFYYFTAIGNILWPFGIFCGHLVYFFPFWYFVQRKIWQPRSLKSGKFNFCFHKDFPQSKRGKFVAVLTKIVFNSTSERQINFKKFSVVLPRQIQYRFQEDFPQFYRGKSTAILRWYNSGWKCGLSRLSAKMHWNQGDQMSFVKKITQNVAKHIFCQD
jgi:hypothetical protein